MAAKLAAINYEYYHTYLTPCDTVLPFRAGIFSAAFTSFGTTCRGKQAIIFFKRLNPTYYLINKIIF